MTVHVDHLIHRYFEGRVRSPEERDRLFAHVHRCMTCRAQFNHLAGVHRAVFGDEDGLSGPELSLIAPALIGARAPRRSALAVLGLAAAVGALAVTLLFTQIPLEPKVPEFAIKGGGQIGEDSAVLDVLCFDDAPQVVRQVKEGRGSCPAPGYLKLVFVSPRTVPHMSVAAIVKNEVRYFRAIAKPKSGQIMDGHVAIHPGETIQFLVASGDEPIDERNVRQSKSSISIVAEAR